MATCTYNHKGELQIEISDVPRCPHPDAKRNYLRSRTGSMHMILAWTAKEDGDDLDYSQVPRIKPEAEDNYAPHRGGRMEK